MKYDEFRYFSLLLQSPGRRISVLVCGLAIMLASFPGTATAAPLAPILSQAVSAAALPGMNMELVVVASEVETGSRQLPVSLGDDASTKLVQAALNAKVPASLTVDGGFGTVTRAKFSDWQRKLGYTGLGANGLPGLASLTKLGDNRYTLHHPIRVGSKITYPNCSTKSCSVNSRTRDMLVAADSRVSWSIRVVKGSYDTSDNGSAGTHDGGGAVDITVSGMTQTQKWQTVQALRAVGFAAWYRTTAQFPAEGEHIHAIAVGDTDMHTEAAAQVADYFNNINGLCCSTRGADNQPAAYDDVVFTWWEVYQRAHS